ncbi:hypothetical protein [Thiohalospira sp.]|uniref:hypothetical protein n=1 Tax=Thiohalospira sp. TaxID=3080549 RepID=UPI0039815D34
MSHHAYALPVLAVATLTSTGCGTAVPDCAASGTTETARQIVSNTVEETFQQSRNQFEHLADSFDKTLEPEVDTIQYRLENIRTREFDEASQRYACTATLAATMNGREETQELRYTSQHNAEGEHYVEIQGLTEQRIGELLTVAFREGAE